MQFQKWFEGPTKIDGKKASVHDVGELLLPSGRVVACDPLAPHDSKELERKVGAGAYPVRVVHLADTRVVAFAQLVLAPGKVVRWELAKMKGGNTSYTTETGTGAFADAVLVKRLVKAMLDDDDVSDTMQDAFEDEDVPWLLYAPEGEEDEEEDDDEDEEEEEEDDQPNIAMFNSGHGDGSYQSYWGLDAAGKALCLVTDFGVAKD